MTINEAVLKSLEDLIQPTSYKDVYNHIIEKKLYDFGSGKTPSATISASLCTFVNKGDSRIKRVKDDGVYKYYLTKNENSINFIDTIELTKPQAKEKKSKNGFSERDLHKLLSSYLRSTNIYSKTIFHEQSKNNKDNHQKWIHPDMIGVKFLNLKTTASKNFVKAIDKIETFKIYSYELKKEINTDYELKQYFFQAVSNSSWANYGYLVAFEINDQLEEEMERLNQSFGIGIIELRANPYESKILYPAKYHKLDFKTIDKICNINKDFNTFVENTEKLLTADEKYEKSTKSELENFCDDIFKDDSEIEKYCNEKAIPFEESEILDE